MDPIVGGILILVIVFLTYFGVKAEKEADLLATYIKEKELDHE
jgi:hypothetical protein